MVINGFRLGINLLPREWYYVFVYIDIAAHMDAPEWFIEVELGYDLSNHLLEKISEVEIQVDQVLIML